MYFDPYFSNEKIYFAGPQCFYTHGYPQWYALGGSAEADGFGVTMPTKAELDLTHEDLRENAKTIFANCAREMNETTALICDLEFYRGTVPDGGSLYEAGMAYAKGCRVIGYTRDLRPMKWKYQGAELKNGLLYGRDGQELPYMELPFSPDVVSAMKIVEGDHKLALSVLELDITEARKRGENVLTANIPASTEKKHGRPVVYLAGPERYDADASAKYEKMMEICDSFGLDAIVPGDYRMLKNGDVYEAAYRIFTKNMENVSACDAIVANLNDFQGWEPESDTSFECGVAFQSGKKLFGYMASTARMIERIPNNGEAFEYRDACGCNAENFDYPINLMFSGGPMPIYEGDFAAVIGTIAEQLKSQQNG